MANTRHIVVTHRGPCIMSSNVFAELANRRLTDGNFGQQILFTLEVLDWTSINWSVTDGQVPVVASFDEFEKNFILDDPPGRRNIVI